MAYSGYTKKDGKVYGPYYYKSYRKNGVVKKIYMGRKLPEKKVQKVLPRANFLPFAILFIALGVFIGFLLFAGPTGRVALQVQPTYEYNTSLSGQAIIKLQEGDLIQKDTQLEFILLKDSIVVTEKTMTLEEFLVGKIDYVELTKESIFCENVSVYSEEEICEEVAGPESVEEICTPEVQEACHDEERENGTVGICEIEEIQVCENVTIPGEINLVCSNQTLENVEENCTTINVTDYYYNAPGEYPAELSIILSYNLEDVGEYVLQFNIPSINVSDESTFVVMAPSTGNETEPLVNETEEPINETILNETLLNETILNETLLNETLLNETNITNMTLVNLTFQEVNMSELGFEKEDVLEYRYSDVGLTYSCSYYWAKNPSNLSVSAKSEKDKLKIKDFVNKKGKIKKGTARWEIFDSEVGDYVPLDKKDFKNLEFLSGEQKSIKFCAEHTFEAGNENDGFAAKVEIDHIPQFMGFDYDEMTWWNVTWAYKKTATITNNNDTTALANYSVQIDPRIYNTTALMLSDHFSEGDGVFVYDTSGQNNKGTHYGNTMGLWRFDENTGTTAYDVGPYGNNGTLVNGTAWATGKSNYGMTFDGVNDYVSVPDSTSLKFGSADFTLAIWIKTNSTGGTYPTMFYKQGGASNYPVYGLRLTPSGTAQGLAVDCSTGGCGYGSTRHPVDTTKVVADNNWHYIVFTRAGTLQTIYVDGIANGTLTETAWNTDSVSTLYIGSAGGSLYFNGTLDEAGIYSRALNASEVSTMYNTGKAKFTDWTTGKFGNGMTFDGVNDYVNMGDPTSGSLDFGTRDFAVMAWVKKSTTTGRGYIVNKMRDTSSWYPGYGIAWDADNTFVSYIAQSGSGAGAYTSAFGINTWHHVALVRSSGAALFYVDGINVVNYSANYNTDNANNFNIGRESVDGDQYLNGTIDEVRIYNRSLSAAEVQEVYNATKVKLDYGDVRFAQGSDELGYWIGKDNELWVKVPSVSANGTANVQMYYGNPSASSSSNSSAVWWTLENTSWRYGGAGDIRNDEIVFVNFSSVNGNSNNLAFLRRIDANSNVVFNTTPAYSNHYDAAWDSAGGYAVPNFYCNDATYGYSGCTMYLQKWNSTNALVINKSIRSGNNVFARGIAIDSGNNIIVAGAGGPNYMWFGKYNSTGDLQCDYSDLVGSGDWWVMFYDVAVDSSNNIIAGGTSDAICPNVNQRCARLDKINSTCGSLWSVNPLNSSYDSIVSSLAVNNESNILTLVENGPTASHNRFDLMFYNSTGSNLWNKTDFDGGNFLGWSRYNLITAIGKNFIVGGQDNSSLKPVYYIVSASDGSIINKWILYEVTGKGSISAIKYDKLTNTALIAVQSYSEGTNHITFRKHKFIEPEPTASFATEQVGSDINVTLNLNPGTIVVGRNVTASGNVQQINEIPITNSQIGVYVNNSLLNESNLVSENSHSPAWFNLGWKYRKNLTVINNNATEALANYSVSIDPAFYNTTGLLLSTHFSEGDGSVASDTSGQNNKGTHYGNTVGLWHFDENISTTAYDASPYGNNGTITGATWAAGKSNSGLSFDGNDYVDFGDKEQFRFINATGITLDFWFKTTQSGYGFFLNKDNYGIGNIRQIMIYHNGNKVECAFFSGNQSGGVSPAIYTTGETGAIDVGAADGNWHHLVCTIDKQSNNGSLYVDGVLRHSGALTGNWSYAAGLPLVLGKRAVGSYPYYFVGAFDEVAVYNKGLSQAEVSAHYNAGKAKFEGWRDNGKYGSAMEFDGVNDYTTLTDIDLPSTFSFSLWIKPNSITNNPMIINKDADASRSYYINSNSSGSLQLSIRNTGGLFTQYATNSPAVSTGQWQHVVTTYDGGLGADQKMKFYVNGENKPAVHLSTYDNGGTPANIALPVRFGVWGDLNSNWFNGTLDEVRIYNRTLSAAEASELYNATKARLDYGDVRFAQNKTELGYWMEQDDKFWFKVPNIPAGGTAAVQMYYGNPSANTTSNADNAFLFYDDFSNNIDWANKWQSTDHTLYTVSGGIMTATPASVLTKLLNTKNSYNNYILELAVKPNTPTRSLTFTDFEASQATFAQTDYIYSDTLGNLLGVAPGGTEVTVAPWENVWYRHVAKMPSTGNATFTIYYLNGAQRVTATKAPTVNRTNYPSIVQWVGGTSNYDWVLVRGYASPEPTTATGIESYRLQTGSSGNYNFTFTAPVTAATYPVKVNTTYQGKYDYDEQNLTVRDAAVYSTFDGSTTDFNSAPDISNVCQPILEKTGFGKIQWDGCVDASGANFNSNVNLSLNLARVNSSALHSSFNSSANVTLYGLTFSNSGILWDPLDNGTFVKCPDNICTKLSYASGNLLFNVTQFTGYSGGENPNVTLISPANNSIVVTPLTFVTNITAVTNLTNASLWHNISGTWALNDTWYYGNIAAESSTVGLWHLDEGDGKTAADSALTNNGTHYGNTVGLWRFDENTSTTAYDASPYGNNGTISGANWTTGKSYSGLSFDGVNDYASVPDANSLDISGSYSYEVWFKTNTTNNRVAMEKGTNQLFILQPAGDALFYGHAPGKSATSPPIWDNQFHHLAIVYDSSSTAIKLYIDGSLFHNSTIIAPVPNANALYIGSRAGTQYFWNGTLDELAIYSKALGAAEVLAHYNAGKAKFTDWTNSSKLGSYAMEFEGVDDYVALPNNAFDANTQGTVSAWVYPKKAGVWFGVGPTAAEFPYIYFPVTADCSSWGLVSPCPGFEWYISSGSRYYVYANVTIPYNQWSHIAYTGNGTTTKVYVNGVEITNVYVGDTGSNRGWWFDDFAAGTAYYSIGVLKRLTPYNYFNGTIDEVIIYNRSLSASEVKTLYSRKNPSINSTADTVNWTISNISVGTYKWNVQAFDSAGLDDWGDSNYTLKIYNSNLTECKTIDVSGSYTLVNNVSSSGTCFTIAAENVTIDCKGYTIDGAEVSVSYGINNPGYNNLTVKNCKITDFGYAVRYYSANNGLVMNNSFSSQDESNVYCAYSTNLTVFNNTLDWGGGFSEQNAYGMLLLDGCNYANITSNSINVSSMRSGMTFQAAHNGTAERNTIVSAGYGVHIQYSNGVNIFNNTIDNTARGIYVSSTYDNINKNNLYSNSYGLYLEGSNNNVTDNTLSLNNYGVYFGGGDSYILTGNNATGNTLWDFYSTTNSLDNVVINLTTQQNLISFISKDISLKGLTTVGVPTDPTNYYNISKYVNITNNSATSWAYLNVSYNNETDVPAGVNESTLKIWKNNDSGWTLVPGANGVDTASKIVYANITNFGSTFAPLGLTATEISSCQTLNSAGTYLLTQNISGSGTCLTIGADNVELDCQGWTITGDGVTNNTYGVYGTGRNNVTVRNCAITNYSAAVNAMGIYFNAVSNSYVLNNNIYNVNRGIYVSSSSGDTIANNTISNTIWSGSYGQSIMTFGTNSTLVSGNIISNSSMNGITVSGTSGTGPATAFNNIVEYNIVNRTYSTSAGGIVVLTANNSIVRYNNVSSVVAGGVVVNNGGNNTIEYNRIVTPGIGGLVAIAANATSNRYRNNTVIGAAYGIYVNGTTGTHNSNNFLNNTIENSTSYDIYIRNAVNSLLRNITIKNENTTSVVSLTGENITVVATKGAFPADTNRYNITHYVDLTNLTAGGWAYLNVSYNNETDVPADVAESTLKIYRYSGGDWVYKKPIFVNTSTNLDSYQVLLNVSFVLGKMNSNFSDLRFTNTAETIELPYWIENYTESGSALVWVKGNFTTANGTQIYMHYGNPSASSASNGTATFALFDDFTTNTGWTEVDPNNYVWINTTSQRLEWYNDRDADAYIYKATPSPAGEFAMDFDVLGGPGTGDNPGSWGNVYAFAGYGDVLDDTFTWATNKANATILSISGTSYVRGFYTTQYVNGSESNSDKIREVSYNTPYYVTIIRNSTNVTLNVYTDAARTTHFSGTVSSPQSMGVGSLASYPYFFGHVNRNDGNSGYRAQGWLDNVKVRKYSSLEPTAAFGNEVADSWPVNWILATTAPYTADSYTKLLLHMDGTDASTTFTDSETTPKAVSANGDAQIDTAQSKFGGASGLFDGTDDYLNLSDSDDWYFGTGNFTIDFWVKMNSVTQHQGFFGQATDASHGTLLYWDKDSNLIVLLVYNAGSVIFVTYPWTPTISTWYHMALVRNGTGTGGIACYINGQALTPTLAGGSWDGSFMDWTGSFMVGYGSATSGQYFNGWMDEFRISKGIARWIANFTPPGDNGVDLVNKVVYANITAFGSTFAPLGELSNQAPQVTYVQAISDTDPVAGNSTPVQFTITVYDSNGFDDINDSSIRANFTKAAVLRENTSCALLADYDANYSNYSCTIHMWYYDSPGNWSVSVYAEDYSQVAAVNDSTYFLYKELLSFINSADAINASGITGGNASFAPMITSTNVGNVEATFCVSGTNLTSISLGFIPVNAVYVGSTPLSYSLAPIGNLSYGPSENITTNYSVSIPHGIGSGEFSGQINNTMGC